jgi:hypothetical protein
MLRKLTKWLSGGYDAMTPRTVPPPDRVPTQLSATLFAGEARPWVSYLSMKPKDRCDPDIQLDVLWGGRNRVLAFREHSQESRLLAQCLNNGWRIARERLQAKPFAAEVLDALVFGNRANGETDLQIRVSPALPSDASREIQADASLAATGVRIVFQKRVVEQVLEAYRHASATAGPDECLGVTWTLLQALLTQLGYPNYPRDRFVERIDLSTRICLLTINLLYGEVRGGKLVPNRAGEAFEAFVSRRHGLDGRDLHGRHPYFRLLDELRFLLHDKLSRDYEAEAKILVREYLDDRYLRLSLAGIMPDVAESMAPLPYCWETGTVSEEPPTVGRYGIMDQDDLKAWRKVARPFRDLGFSLLRQVGMGEFGRVYEALNHANPNLPPRVAVKVDRLRRWKKSKQIQAIETMLQTSRDLAASPHVIRIFDAGRLSGKKLTYHVLQFIDGDTLDNLIGVTGAEHASVSRPSDRPRSEKEARETYQSAQRNSRLESWRRRRLSQPFAQSLTLTQALDLLTSILLWVEEIHSLGYVINDLKHGNLMVSRRGQVKGIDMDSYGPYHSSLDKFTDFFFLSVSLLLFFVNLDKSATKPRLVGPEGLPTQATVRETITASWPFGDVASLSRGRVQTEQVIDLVVDLIERSRNHGYAREAELFTADLNRLIRLKRTISLEEIVLD